LLFHFSSVDGARRALKLAPPPPRRRWSQERVIAELQRLHAAGHRLTNRALEAAGHRGLANAARNYCDGLPRARLLAGLPEPEDLRSERQAWSADLVIDEILERRAAGEPLAAADVRSKLLAAGGYYFGNWGEAIEAAGLDYDEIRLVRAPYTRDELIDLVIELAAERPEMTLGELHRHQACDALQAEFGTFEAAAAAAGLQGWPRRLQDALLDLDETRAAIQARHDAGRPLNAASVEDEDNRLYRSAMRHIGGWDAAVVDAGLRPEPRHQLGVWNPESTGAALDERAARRLPMSPSAIRRDDSALYYAAKKWLGYNAEMAIAEYGAPRLVRHWTREEVVAELRAVTARGEVPSPALKLAARKQFGSMGAARRSSGLRQLRTPWDRGRVIREIREWAKGDRQRPRGVLISTAQRLFGSWRAAQNAAGVEPLVRARWTTDEIRAALIDRLEKGLPMNTKALVRDDRSLYDAVKNHLGTFSKVVAKIKAEWQAARSEPPSDRT
jgi:hypothetical protein